MKKFVSILLAVALLLVGAFLTCALAEGEGGDTPPAPMVDLTRMAVSVLVLIFEFLLAWIARVIVPPLRKWLATNTTEKQRGLLWDAVTSLVEAAEQTILGPGRGKERLEYVVAGLMRRGFTVDLDMIESAVKSMNDEAKQAFREAFEPLPGGVLTATKEIAPVDLDENGEPDLNVEHWSLAQLKTFFRINGFPDTGFTTRDDYINFILEPPAIFEDDGTAYKVTPEELEAVQAALDKLHKEKVGEPQEAPQEAEEPQSVNE